MPRERKARKRANNTGSLTKRTYTRSDGSTYIRWEGRLTVGYDDEGKPHRKPVYGKTQAEAIAKMQEIRQQLNSGTYSSTDLTVKAYFEKWLPEKARTVAPRTAELYREQAEHHVYPRTGRVKLAKLTTMQVQDVVRDLADQVGISTANKVRGLLLQAMGRAVKWQLVRRNVVEGVAKLRETPREPQVWTLEQAVRFLDTIQGHRLYTAFYLDMATGMRRGELLGLRWQDVQDGALIVRQALKLLGGKLTFGPPKTKNGVRRVDITPDAQDVLEQHRKRQEAEREFLGEAWPDTGLAFTSKVGTPIYPRNFERAWCAAQKAADVPHAWLHDLRHLRVSMLVEDGASIGQVAEQIGDTVAVVNNVYTHLFEGRRRTPTVGLAELLKRGKPN